VHDDRALAERRIDRELWERVMPLVHRDHVPLSVHAGPSVDDLAPFEVGGRWGAPWATTWFRFSGEIPSAWRGRRVEAVIDLGFHPDAAGFQCEGLVVDDDGRPVQGIHPRRTNLAVDACPGPIAITLEAASNPSFPQFRPSPLGGHGAAEAFTDSTLYRLRRAELVVVDGEAEALVHDLHVLDGVMRTLALDDPRRARIRHAITRALDTVPDVGAARHVLRPALSLPARASAHHVVATGHAHIDTAWLWPLRETVRKCTRTFASAVAMLRDRPEYVFSCSQAQQYAWIEERHPDLFADIAQMVADGRWIPVGGMWVEADMNMPSGESLVRQIVHGQRYFEERFGVRSTEVWIPDVFGYPAGLPQVFAAGGMHRFVTQKLSWNKQNRFPHHTFWWEGLDGTRVLTHFPPVDTYNSELTPAELAHASSRFTEHAWSGWSLAPFGHGDGGGGPTREMLERAARVADLDGMPTVEIGSPATFFEHVEREIVHGAPVPVWRGELYLETHRGTLTSQIRTKLGNRRCERLLHELELWSATARRHAGADHLWREVLTQQFHDILPGSSIGWVHADAEATHTRVADDLESRIASVLVELAPSEPTLVNAAAAPVDGVVVVDLPDGPAGDGPAQRLSDGSVAFRTSVPGFGLAAAEALHVVDRVVVTDRSMANRSLAVRWDEHGALTSVIDIVRARELVPEGARCAGLELAPDHPVEYDAWDLESWTISQGRSLGGHPTIELLDGGPLVGRLRVRHEIEPSTVTVTYSMRAGSPRLDVHVAVDWHHREHLLSMVFPFDVRADVASCDVQFGVVRRPTHPSSRGDAAKFEVCAHRFVDLSEPSSGVAVINDGRYGHGVFDGRIRVSLLRGARYPDPDADDGHHEVTLAVLPHGPGLTDVLREAEHLNRPLRLVTGTADVRPAPLVELTGDGVEIDAVKLADDGSGDLVVRLHEAVGDHRPVTVRTDRRVAAATRCNLLEEPSGGIEVGDGIVALVLRPFELVTLRITPDARGYDGR
jgi:alpha-mannosidase